jgi:hypothetical protein
MASLALSRRALTCGRSLVSISRNHVESNRLSPRRCRAGLQRSKQYYAATKIGMYNFPSSSPRTLRLSSPTLPHNCSHFRGYRVPLPHSTVHATCFSSPYSGRGGNINTLDQGLCAPAPLPRFLCTEVFISWEN